MSEPFLFLLLFTASFFAGLIDSIAGGGGLLQEILILSTKSKRN